MLTESDTFVWTKFVRTCDPRAWYSKHFASVLPNLFYRYSNVTFPTFLSRQNDQFTRGISWLKSFWPTNTTFRGFNCTVTYNLATYRAVNCMMKSGADLRPLTQRNETRQVLHTSGWFRQGREPERQVPLWVAHAKRLRLANRLTNTKSQWLFDLVLVKPKEPRPTTNTHTHTQGIYQGSLTSVSQCDQKLSGLVLFVKKYKPTYLQLCPL